MDKVTQEDISPQSESELTSPLSLKRLRTDWTVTKDLSEKSTFDSSGPPTVPKSFLSSSHLQSPESLGFIAQCGHFQHKNPRDKPQDDLNVPHLTTSHQSGVDKESDKACCVSAELAEKPSLTETDKLSPHLSVAADVSPPPINNNTSSPPNCEQLGKSCEDEAPGSFSLSTGNDKDGTQSDVSQLQAVPFCSNQPDCSSKDPEKHTGLCYTSSQLAEVVETNQERLESDFSNSVPLSKAEDKSPVSSHPEEDLSGNITEDGKNEKQKPELQSCEDENLSDCLVKTEVNENDSSKILFCSAAACAEGSNLPNPVVLGANIGAENVSFEVSNYIGADHSSETSKISLEPAEGDNDSDAFSEIDAEVEGMLCNSDITAGRELSPVVKTCNLETALTLCCNDRTSQGEEFIHRGTTQLGKDENQVRCQSRTEPQAFSVTGDETQDETDSKGDCQLSPSSCPMNPPPAVVGGTQQSPDTVGQHSSCFAVSPDRVETQVEYSQSQADSGTEAAGMKGEELKEKQIDEPWSLAQLTKIGETSDHASIGDDNLKCAECEQGDEAESLSDKPGINVMVVTTDGEEQCGGINGGKEIKPSERKNSEMWEIPGEDKKNPRPMSRKKADSIAREESPDESISEWVEGSRFTVCSGDDSEQSLGCFSHYQLSSDVFLTSPSANDAVVPCQPFLAHSENPQCDSTALKCSDRFPPSASALCSPVLGEFDTFEKIKLSPDYDNDAALSNMPFLPSLTGEMLKTPEQQLQHHTAKTELDIHRSEEEEEMEGIECHMDNMANRFVSSDSSHIDASNSLSAADVIELAWSEQQPNWGSASDSSHNESNPQSRSSPAAPESDSPPPELNHGSQFEMKEHFDKVLKELHLFFDISRNDLASACGPKSPEQCSDVPEPPESHAARVTSKHLSSSDLGCLRETSADKADEDHSLETCEVDPAVSLPVASRDGEQEVPLNKNLSQKPLSVAADKHKEPRNVEQEVKMWSPSIMYLPLLEQMRHRPPEQHRRLEPLKTCTRPIRVGLSKRAKTKHLHRSHPYK